MSMIVVVVGFGSLDVAVLMEMFERAQTFLHHLDTMISSCMALEKIYLLILYIFLL